LKRDAHTVVGIAARTTRRLTLIEHVDPFIGSSVTDLPVPQGLAETWWWPKPQVGNTHPGATYPFGMVSVCAYSGAYPTGYGLYQLSTEGVPAQLYDTQIASGFTHFQQSGTGAIRKYYNYLPCGQLPRGKSRAKPL
jgi:Glycosyl hydrolase family 92 N-terminal domain